MTTTIKPQPGDTIRVQLLKRGGELGDIRIQWYDHGYRVGSFLPGREEWVEGDTPKTWPDRESTFTDKAGADAEFLLRVGKAIVDGWSLYSP